jgi:hypothetical protein
MRGQKIFKEIIKESSLHSAIRKGRSNSLLSKRNECMVARYYYYGSIKNKVYEETLRLLVSEFFLSPATISFQVQEHTDQLQSLKRNCPSLYYFQSRWPHLKW